MFRPITTHDSVQLKWWETADPAVLGISYEVQRRQGVGSYSVISGSYGNYTHYQDGTVGISFTDSSVSPDTTYAYRVYAIQGGRRSDSPSRATITTKPAPIGVVEPVRASRTHSGTNSGGRAGDNSRTHSGTNSGARAGDNDRTHFGNNSGARAGDNSRTYSRTNSGGRAGDNSRTHFGNNSGARAGDNYRTHSRYPERRRQTATARPGRCRRE